MTATKRHQFAGTVSALFNKIAHKFQICIDFMMYDCIFIIIHAGIIVTLDAPWCDCILNLISISSLSDSVPFGDCKFEKSKSAHLKRSAKIETSPYLRSLFDEASSIYVYSIYLRMFKNTQNLPVEQLT